MSWVEKVKTGLTIKCGDGKSYTPNYLNPQKSKEYNIAEFNFDGIDGTLVKRKAPQGRKYPVEFYFQGEDHLDTIEAFEASADDPRPWTLTHPLYGELRVQPAALKFDNTKHGITKVTGVLLETIDAGRPTATVSPVDAIVEAKTVADEASAAAYTAKTPTVSGLTQLLGNAQGAYEQGKQYAGQAGAAYANAMSKVNSTISTAQAALGSPALGISTAVRGVSQSIQFLTSFPNDFIANISDRYTALGAQFSRLGNQLTPASMSVEAKGQYALQAGTIVTTAATNSVVETVIDEDGNEVVQQHSYASVLEALQSIEIITSFYESYVANMDLLQTENGGSITSYIPDMAAMQAIEEVVNLTVSNLLNIALNSQQERTVILEADSNAINLTHRFYGMDAADTNLIRFIQTNNLSLNEYLLIRKGTAIVYYV